MAKHMWVDPVTWRVYYKPRYDCKYDHCSDWFITGGSYSSHLRIHVEVVCLFCHKEMTMAENHHHSRLACAKEQIVASNREKQEASCPQ